MTNKLMLIGTTLVLAISFMEPAAATGTIKCGTHIVSAGQGKPVGQYEVLKRCGEPTARQGNTWLYKRSSSVMRSIRFNSNGEIVAIN